MGWLPVDNMPRAGIVLMRIAVLRHALHEVDSKPPHAKAACGAPAASRCAVGTAWKDVQSAWSG
jgi:hypothetical protein